MCAAVWNEASRPIAGKGGIGPEMLRNHVSLMSRKLKAAWVLDLMEHTDTISADFSAITRNALHSRVIRLQLASTHKGCTKWH